MDKEKIITVKIDIDSELYRKYKFIQEILNFTFHHNREKLEGDNIH